jgi:hypothetical protein
MLHQALSDAQEKLAWDLKTLTARHEDLQQAHSAAASALREESARGEEVAREIILIHAEILGHETQGGVNFTFRRHVHRRGSSWARSRYSTRR